MISVSIQRAESLDCNFNVRTAISTTRSTAAGLKDLVVPAAEHDRRFLSNDPGYADVPLEASRIDLGRQSGGGWQYQ